MSGDVNGGLRGYWCWDLSSFLLAFSLIFLLVFCNKFPDLPEILSVSEMRYLILSANSWIFLLEASALFLYLSMFCCFICYCKFSFAVSFAAKAVWNMDIYLCGSSPQSGCWSYNIFFRWMFREFVARHFALVVDLSCLFLVEHQWISWYLWGSSR